MKQRILRMLDAHVAGTVLAGLLLLSVNNASGEGKAPPADFHVAMTGKDTNPGTADKPFATIAQARDAVRAIIKAGLTKDILVQIRGGNYEQTGTMTFGPEDSGTTSSSITYAAAPGEKVVLSGGRKITGWTKGAGGIWTAGIPEAKAGKWYPRQLFVNGQRATRARSPNQGWTEGKPVEPIIQTSTDQNVVIKVNSNQDGATWSNVGDIELVSLRNNEGGRKTLQSVDLALTARTVTLRPPHRWAPKVFSNDWFNGWPDGRCYLENALEFLDVPGEWYLDRNTGILSYWPRPGEDLATSEIVAPVVQKTLLSLAGTRERPVENLHFRGIHVEHVDWPLPEEGYMGLFSNNVPLYREGGNTGHRFIDAAVEVLHSRSCSFRDGGIRRAGGMGLVLREGTADIIVEGNEIGHLGAGGIAGGHPNVCFDYLLAAPPPGPNEYKGYRIANNHVHHLGLDYFGATGICMYPTQDTTIAHNLIHDVPYVGIMIAGDQDPKTPFSGNNVVEYNEIHSVMQVACDGAGLYVIFVQPVGNGLLVRGNLVHDIPEGDHPHGYKVGSTGIIVDGRPAPNHKRGVNLVNNVVWGIHHFAGPLTTAFHPPEESTWIDNLFLTIDSPPPGVEIIQGYAGLQPVYRRALLKPDAPQVDYYPLTADHPLNEASVRTDVWSGGQFHRSPDGHGLLEIFRRKQATEDSARFKLRGLDAERSYDLQVFVASYKDLKTFEHSPNRVCTRYDGMAFVESLDKDLTATLPPAATGPVLPGGKRLWTGRQLMEEGLLIKASPEQVILIAY